MLFYAVHTSYTHFLCFCCLIIFCMKIDIGIVMCSLSKIDCVFCCDSSVTNPNPKTVKFNQIHTGLKCQKCRKFSCIACLRVICAEMQRKKLKDDWSEHVERYLSGNPSSHSFICNSCEFPTNIHGLNPHTPRRFDGYIFLPEYALLIAPNFSGVDVFALGKDSLHSLDAVLHAVVDEETAVECESQNVVPDKSAARIVDMYSRQIKHNGNTLKVCSLVFGFDCLLFSCCSHCAPGQCHCLQAC